MGLFGFLKSLVGIKERPRYVRVRYGPPIGYTPFGAVRQPVRAESDSEVFWKKKKNALLQQKLKKAQTNRSRYGGFV